MKAVNWGGLPGTAGWYGDAIGGSGNEQSERRITCCGQLLWYW